MANGLPEGFEASMRAAELVRRNQRRQVILNHAALDDAADAPDEAIETEAIAQIQAAHDRFLYDSVPHFPSRLYWVRLWKAIKGSP